MRPLSKQALSVSPTPQHAQLRRPEGMRAPEVAAMAEDAASASAMADGVVVHKIERTMKRRMNMEGIRKVNKCLRAIGSSKK